MTQLTDTSPLLAPASRRPADSTAEPEILAELAGLALQEKNGRMLAERFHTLMAGHLGKPSAPKLLLGIQELIHRGEAAGARFLAAYLDVSTPGARLVPLVQDFSSVRRLMKTLEADQRPPSPLQAEWLRRVERVSRETQDLLDILGLDPGYDPDRPGQEPPWPAWRRCFMGFLNDVVAGRGLMPDSRNLMADMIRLEADAWQERTSNLAGGVDPFNTLAVKRLLPVLAQADGQVRDLLQLAEWVLQGKDDAAFTNRVSSAMETMAEDDHRRLRQLVRETPTLATLARLAKGLEGNPLERDKLAAGVAGLLAVGRQLSLAGTRSEDLGLVDCVELVQRHRQGKYVRVPLGAELIPVLKKILLKPRRESDLSLWPLSGVRVLGGFLEIPLSGPSLKDGWENFLPCPLDEHPRAAAPKHRDDDDQDEAEDEAENPEDMTASAIKHLVMSNIMSTSVTLGFLRNPKVIAIPGLVAEVAARTRNPQIIETIATDRALYTGFANREVPRICLQSPCNTSVKTLRKFIHVKYVSKVDLRRMASDRAGMRREVIREIEKYLEALA